MASGARTVRHEVGICCIWLEGSGALASQLKGSSRVESSESVEGKACRAREIIVLIRALVTRRE